MKRVIITPADLGGTALDELKQWLGITTASQDQALVGLLRASLDMCEAFIGAMPLAAPCEEIWPARGDWQCLATRPVHAITAIEGIPAEGSRFALAADAYEIDLEADGTGKVRILRPGAAGRVAIGFVAGLAADWTALPGGLRHGIIRLAGQQYRDRDNGQLAAPPAAVTALWQPWRRMRLT